MRILMPILLALAMLAPEARADQPDDRRAKIRALRKKIRARALQLRVQRASKRLSLSADERQKLEALLRKHDRGRLALRRERRTLRRAMKKLDPGDDAGADELFERFLAHKRKALANELSRAGELRELLGSNRGLRATVILTRIERRIEARMRSAMRKGRKGRRGRKDRRDHERR